MPDCVPPLQRVDKPLTICVRALLTVLSAVTGISAPLAVFVPLSMVTSDAYDTIATRLSGELF